MNRAMTNKIECFFCKKGPALFIVDRVYERQQVWCPDCGARGPFKPTEDEALKAWVGVATALSAPPNRDEDFEAIRADARMQENAAKGRNEPRLSDAFGMIKELAQLLRDKGPS